MKSERRPCRSRRIKQIILADARWSPLQMAFDVWKHATEKSKPFVHASRNLLSVRHRASSRQRPEADFRMHFERPPLAFHRDGVVHLLNLRGDSKSLLAESSSGYPKVYGTGDGMILCG
jgi:hypothetical protein